MGGVGGLQDRDRHGLCSSKKNFKSPEYKRVLMASFYDIVTVM